MESLPETKRESEFARLSGKVASVQVATAERLTISAVLIRSLEEDRFPKVPIPLYEKIKFLVDTLCAVCALFLLAPLFLLISLLIYLEDNGPVLYFQTRIGRNGKPFRFYKFRSMVTNADALKVSLEQHNEAHGPIFKMQHDPRITRIGRLLRKYSLDELPQLINIARGEMRFVGPRPHLPREVAQYAEAHLPRLDVAPGLVCLREVAGRSRLSFEQWVKLDLLYVRHRSPFLDVVILFAAVFAVLSADGAY